MVYRRRNAFGQDPKREEEPKGGKEVEGEGEGDEDKEGEGKKDGEEEEGDSGAAQCIWLARIKPEHCEGLVKFTVLQGKVVKPEKQLRGGFDRGKGLLSW